MSVKEVLFKHMKVQTSPDSRLLLENVVMPLMSHGDRVVELETGKEDLKSCDALVTVNQSLSLGIKTADCAPICLTDGEKIGIAHVGWPGLCLGLIPQILAHFNLEKLEVYVGPHLHSFAVRKDGCYEKIEAVFGEEFFVEEDAQIIFNFKSAIASQLPTDAVFDEVNTATDLAWPSHRRNGTKQRLMTVVQFNV